MIRSKAILESILSECDNRSGIFASDITEAIKAIDEYEDLKAKVAELEDIIENRNNEIEELKRQIDEVE